MHNNSNGSNASNYNALNQPRPRIFLSARWSYLTMLNYRVDPGILVPYVPAGTELDSWNGGTYLSLVGFRFLHTRVWGIRFPYHSDFNEVNLRFYVRRISNGEVRRGVVFICEIVPQALIAAVARRLYNEQYIALPMKHKIEVELSNVPSVSTEYQWRLGGRWQRLRACATGHLLEAKLASLAQFITEHYWGYAKQRDGGSVEYQVVHAPWRVWPNAKGAFEGDARTLYGPHFARVLAQTPESVFIADGSAVDVFAGQRIA